MADAQLSEFERCRKNCARLALDTRNSIKDRDDLLNRGVRSTDSIKASSTSRQKLAALRAEAVKMDALYQAEKKKAEKSAGKKGQGLLQEEQLTDKLSTLELVQQHVEGKARSTQQAVPQPTQAATRYASFCIQMRMSQRRLLPHSLRLLMPPPPPRVRLA